MHDNKGDVHEDADAETQRWQRQRRQKGLLTLPATGCGFGHAPLPPKGCAMLFYIVTGYTTVSFVIGAIMAYMAWDFDKRRYPTEATVGAVIAAIGCFCITVIGLAHMAVLYL